MQHKIFMLQNTVNVLHRGVKKFINKFKLIMLLLTVLLLLLLVWVHIRALNQVMYSAQVTTVIQIHLYDTGNFDCCTISYEGHVKCFFQRGTFNTYILEQMDRVSIHRTMCSSQFLLSDSSAQLVYRKTSIVGQYITWWNLSICLQLTTA